MISDGEDEHPNYARCEWLIDGKFRKKQKKKKKISTILIALARCMFFWQIKHLSRGESEDLLLLLHCCFVALLFYVHGKHLRSCRDYQLT